MNKSTIKIQIFSCFIFTSVWWFSKLRRKISSYRESKEKRVYIDDWNSGYECKSQKCWILYLEIEDGGLISYEDLLETQLSKIQGQFEGHENFIYSVLIAVDCKHVISYSADHTIRIWCFFTHKE